MKVCYMNKNSHQKDSKEPFLYYISQVNDEGPVYSRLMHMHKNETELLLVKQGHGTYLIDGKKYTVEEGDLLVFNRLVPHEEYLEHEDFVETYCIGIENLCNGNLKENVLIPEKMCPIFPLKQNYKITSEFIELLFSLAVAQCDAYESLVQGTFLAFLDFLRANVLNSNRVEQDGDVQILAYRAKKYIDENYSEDLKLEEIADHMNVNMYYLSHKFREVFSSSPGAYLIKRRIGEAQTLLQTTEEKITEIAYSVGFNSLSHFQTTFKKQVGQTPKQYRNYYLAHNKKE